MEGDAEGTGVTGRVGRTSGATTEGVGSDGAGIVEGVGSADGTRPAAVTGTVAGLGVARTVLATARPLLLGAPMPPASCP